jgi:hypothetical protein
MTEQQRVDAIGRLNKGYDFFRRTVRDALLVGLTPEKIIDLLSIPETTITNIMLNQVIEREVVVHSEVVPDQPQIDFEDTDTLIHPIDHPDVEDTHAR